MFDGELLGTGVVGDAGEELPSLGDKQVHLRVFVDRDAVRFVQDRSRGSNPSFELEFRGQYLQNTFKSSQGSCMKRTTEQEHAREERLFEVADRQAGYFTAKQALEAGYGYPLQHYHRELGHWVPAGRGLFRLSATRRARTSS